MGAVAPGREPWHAATTFMNHPYVCDISSFISPIYYTQSIKETNQ